MPVSHAHAFSDDSVRTEFGIASAERAWTYNEIHRLCRADSTVAGARNRRMAEQSAAALRYVTANLAHDLNNVLAPVITSIEVLREHFAQDDKARELLSVIERHMRQGPYIAQQVRSLAQGIQQAHARVQPEFLLRGLLRQLKDACPKNITVQLKARAELWPIVGSLPDLHEALAHLCDNAREAMLEGGVLAITAENIVLNDDFHFLPAGTESVRHVLFTVSDTGGGILDDLQECIFDAGFTTKSGGDRGQGLFRANQIAEAHHGHLTLHSEAGQGATFKLYLPAAPGAAPELAAQDIQSLRGHGEGILVVDDEEAMRVVTQQTFESFGYRVLAAMNGADAVSTYLQEGRDIALVVTDMNMPIMDGARTIHALREINPAIKIIATSGQSAATQSRRATQAGANQFIPKPYTAINLLRSVREMLSPVPLAHVLSS